MIRLDRCRLFVAVAEKLSMSEAADSLCLTRSAVSHAIKALEEELGCTLFVRKNREVELTKDGQFFYDAAAPHIRAVERAALELRERKSAFPVTVAAPHGFMKAFVTPGIDGETERRFERFNLVVDTVQGTVRRVLSGEADIGLVNVPEESLPEGLTARRLLTLHSVFVCRREDGRGRRRTLAEFTDEPLITLPRDTVTFRLLSAFCAEHGFSIRPKIESHQLDILHDLVAAGLGIGTSFREIAEKDGRLRILTSEPPLPDQTLLIIRRTEAEPRVLDAEERICQKNCQRQLKSRHRFKTMRNLQYSA